MASLLVICEISYERVVCWQKKKKECVEKFCFKATSYELRTGTVDQNDKLNDREKIPLKNASLKEPPDLKSKAPKSNSKNVMHVAML